MLKHPFTDDEVADLPYENPEGWCDATDGKARVVYTTRWTIYYRRIITNGKSFFEIKYGKGATEQQDDPEDINITEVYPHEVTVIKYKETPNEV